MTQKELNKAVAKDLNETKYQENHVKEELVDDVIKSFVKTTESAIKAGDKVQIAGFGSFEPADRAARVGRNPQTGEEIQIAASKTVKFKAGKAFKALLNE